MPSTKQRRYELHLMRQAGVSSFADGDQVRDHMRMLIASGMSPRRISQLAGVSDSTVYRALGAGNYKPPATMRAELARKILAVRPRHLLSIPAGLVDATGTRRRLQALVACGWSQTQLAARLGIYQTNMVRILTEPTVRASIAVAVRDLYDQLWDVPPRADDHRSRISVSRSRRYAAERGWAPPAAWDDDAIDHPAAAPVSDWRRSSKRRPRAEVAAEALELFGLGLTYPAVAERLGCTTGALERLLFRQGCHVSRRAS